MRSSLRGLYAARGYAHAAAHMLWLAMAYMDNNSRAKELMVRASELLEEVLWLIDDDIREHVASKRSRGD